MFSIYLKWSFGIQTTLFSSTWIFAFKAGLWKLSFLLWFFFLFLLVFWNSKTALTFLFLVICSILPTKTWTPAFTGGEGRETRLIGNGKYSGKWHQKINSIYCYFSWWNNSGKEGTVRTAETEMSPNNVKVQMKGASQIWLELSIFTVSSAKNNPPFFVDPFHTFQHLPSPWHLGRMDDKIR